MDYSFNGEIAKRYGVAEAVFIQNIYWWMAKNEANGKHFYDGRTWTYNSMKAFTELFPFLSHRQVERIIAKLKNAEALHIGNFNQKGFDRTQWYSLGENVLQVYRNGEIHLTERCIPFHQTVKPIPDSKPDSKPDIRDSSSEVASAPADKVKLSFEKDSRPYKCALYLSSQVAERIPGKKYAEATLQSWARDFDKVNRLDGHSWDDIGTVLTFSQADSFWQGNILSGAKFRKQFDQLYLKMQKEDA